ncbi:hypothetical protein IO89_01160 [Epilithonimonas lactis]|uniref:Glycosyltransferase GT-D fold domain-containing protein n=2 Tax=Epilithonimonas lactis TaxID=421072 RepID=A0A085BL87_9FLAO|nr:hypothetical protein IO89_01160 [Epilithonimonas lactis]
MKKYLIKYYLIMRYLPFLLFGKKPTILSFDQTVEEIIRNKKSLARFGDGEICILLLEGEGIGFQKLDYELSLRLSEVINHQGDKLLVSLPNTFGKISELRVESKIFWYGFNLAYAKKILKKIPTNKVFGDTNVTRFYMMYKDKSHLNVLKKVNKLKSIWENQDILIVEGVETKLGVGNNLFANANSISRILCPSKNAFSNYQDIFESVKKYGKNKLILLALGPTATVLAYDLSQENFWALDVGHIDVEYMWFLMNATEKVGIKGKSVNEYNRGISENDSKSIDTLYEQTILTKIE